MADGPAVVDEDAHVIEHLRGAETRQEPGDEPTSVPGRHDEVAGLRDRQIGGHAHEPEPAVVQAMRAVVLAGPRRTEVVKIGLFERQADLHRQEPSAVGRRAGLDGHGQRGRSVRIVDAEHDRLDDVALRRPVGAVKRIRLVGRP